MLLVHDIIIFSALQPVMQSESYFQLSWGNCEQTDEMEESYVMDHDRWFSLGVCMVRIDQVEGRNFN